jgi:succinyl-diaminopimelate desuccinylase
MVVKFDPVELTRDLIRCESVTPHEGGALDYVQARLTELGFRCWRKLFTEPGTPDVDNLYARLGDGPRHLAFAGHTDVVPPGDLSLWSHPPFAGKKTDGAIYGRGASDMKGAIAAFMSAVAGYLEKTKLPATASVSLIITGDEEGPSVNGTEKLLQWMQSENHIPSLCIVGEPTNPRRLGEMLKIGRRGYVNGAITVKGKSGHTAYAHLAKNPIPAMAKVITAFNTLVLDKGNASFQPSNFEWTTVDVGNTADNVVPGAAKAQFNIRFNNEHTRNSLYEKYRNLLTATLEGAGVEAEITMDRGAEAFMTEPSADVELFEKTVRAVTGETPERSTTGGTSDARFIRTYAPVFEFGLTNATIHQIDEQATCADIENLSAIYNKFIEAYLKN